MARQSKSEKGIMKNMAKAKKAKGMASLIDRQNRKIISKTVAIIK